MTRDQATVYWDIFGEVWSLIVETVSTAEGELAYSAQMFFLLALLEGEATPSILARRAAMAPTRISYFLRKLERAKLIVRSSDPDDLRSYSIVLTKKGKQVVHDGKKKMAHAFKAELDIRGTALKKLIQQVL